MNELAELINEYGKACCCWGAIELNNVERDRKARIRVDKARQALNKAIQELLYNKEVTE